MSDGNQQEILLFLIVLYFSKNINVTRCDGVEDCNTFERIHCLKFKLLVLFLYHIVPLFLGQHLCIVNIVFLLQMWVQFLKWKYYIKNCILNKNMGCYDFGVYLLKP